jgi:hypothetical protein
MFETMPVVRFVAHEDDVIQYFNNLFYMQNAWYKLLGEVV